MKHQMKLWNDSFEAIKNRTKTIEMRLNDEKRRLIQIGDLIEFTNTLTKEIINVEVINLYVYDSFDQLYQNHHKVSIGYKENELANPVDMLAYYKIEDIQKYKVLGIEISVL